MEAACVAVTIAGPDVLAGRAGAFFEISHCMVPLDGLSHLTRRSAQRRGARTGVRLSIYPPMKGGPSR